MGLNFEELVSDLVRMSVPIPNALSITRNAECDDNIKRSWQKPGPDRTDLIDLPRLRPTIRPLVDEVGQCTRGDY